MTLAKLATFFFEKEEAFLTSEEFHECLRIMKENTIQSQEAMAEIDSVSRGFKAQPKLEKPRVRSQTSALLSLFAMPDVGTMSREVASSNKPVLAENRQQLQLSQAPDLEIPSFKFTMPPVSMYKVHE